MPTLTNDQDWARLEAEHAAQWADVPRTGIAVGVKFANVPHPLSYGADLPMRGKTHAQHTKAPSKTVGLPRQLIRVNSPHPGSYRPDLPLGQFTIAQLVHATKIEKTAWAARPLVVTPNVFALVEKDVDGKCPTCEKKSCEGIHRRLGVAVVAQNIVEARISSLAEADAAYYNSVRNTAPIVPSAIVTDLPSTYTSRGARLLQKVAAESKEREQKTVIPRATDPLNAGGISVKELDKQFGRVLKRQQGDKPTRSQSERDAIRRAYIAFLKGRAVLADDNASFYLKNDRTGKSRVAPWNTIVFDAFPNPYDFQRAAQAWRSPKNQRTLATH